jgi:hypothetical protein
MIERPTMKQCTMRTNQSFTEHLHVRSLRLDAAHIFPTPFYLHSLQLTCPVIFIGFSVSTRTCGPVVLVVRTLSGPGLCCLSLWSIRWLTDSLSLLLRILCV